MTNAQACRNISFFYLLEERNLAQIPCRLQHLKFLHADGSSLPHITSRLLPSPHHPPLQITNSHTNPPKQKCPTPNATPPSPSSPPTNAPSSAHPGALNQRAYPATPSSPSPHVASAFCLPETPSHAPTLPKPTSSAASARSTT